MKDFNWNDIHQSLLSRGFAKLPQFLTSAQCDNLKELYDDEKLYRSVISMQRYRFGSGEYKYFAYPLPSLIQQLRQDLYKDLFPVANSWAELTKTDITYPDLHDTFITHCHEHDQRRPTPLILKYEAGGFNTLHQDLYGDVYFPFQIVIMLSDPDKDFEGGEFVMLEQIPRAQSKAHVIKLGLGDAMVFTTNFRPAKGAKGFYKAIMKHGISEVTKGRRYALGIILHDAK